MGVGSTRLLGHNVKIALCILRLTITAFLCVLEVHRIISVYLSRSLRPDIYLLFNHTFG